MFSKLQIFSQSLAKYFLNAARTKTHPEQIFENLQACMQLKIN